VIAAGWIGEYIAEVLVGTWKLSYSLPLQVTDARVTIDHDRITEPRGDPRRGPCS
jgi:hypothetical protein